MPNTFLPYITNMRNVFLDQGDTYTGDADVAVTAGFVNNGDLSQAEHAVYFAWSPYRDAMRHASGGGRLDRLAAETDELLPGAKLGDKILVYDDIASLAGDGDYTAFAANLDAAFKRWGVLPHDRGLVGTPLSRIPASWPSTRKREPSASAPKGAPTSAAIRPAGSC
ncbi:hypothetical protein HMSSN036_30440 [Paenibacillus macerans]|nr:hypothetical protein HMSSN036_30440 [Paenibacillus macerans]